MNRIAFSRRLIKYSADVIGAKIDRRIESKALYRLLLSVLFKPVLQARLGYHNGIRRHVYRTILKDESSVVIVVQQLAHESLALDGCHYCGRYCISRLESGKCFIVKKFIYRLEHLDIGIKVHAAIVIKRIEAHIVGNKCPFFVFICFFDILIAVDIKVFFAPFDYLIFGKIFLPRCYAFFNKLRIFGSAEPAEMYYLGYF